MKILFMAALVMGFAPLAQAHFEIGKYEGQLEDGAPCSVEIKGLAFKDGLRHPLNEMVQMTVHHLNHLEVTATHLAVVDAVAGTVRPKAKVLSAVMANSQGANAVELIMGDDGPSQLIYLSDNYRDANQSSRSACVNLKFTGKSAP